MQNMTLEEYKSFLLDKARTAKRATIRNAVEIADGDEDLLHWGDPHEGRYVGAERAEEYGRRNAVPGELLVRVAPTKRVAKKNVSD